MMRAFALLLAAVIGFSGQAFAASEVRQHLESFQRIAFGWEMDKRCGFLGAPESIELEWSFETAFGLLKGDQRSVDMAEAIREAAAEAVGSGRYDCNEAFATQTAGTLEEVRVLLTGLGQTPYEPAASYPSLLSAYLANAASAAAIETRCKLLQGDEHDRLVAGYRNAAGEVSELFGPEAVKRAETAAAATAATVARAHCGEGMRPVLASLFTDLERLSRGLKRWRAL